MRLGPDRPDHREGLEILSFDVGERPNVVPGQAVATIKGGIELAEKAGQISRNTAGRLRPKPGTASSP